MCLYYSFGGDDLSPLGSHKRQGDSLMSPRKKRLVNLRCFRMTIDWPFSHSLWASDRPKSGQGRENTLFVIEARLYCIIKDPRKRPRVSGFARPQLQKSEWGHYANNNAPYESRRRKGEGLPRREGVLAGERVTIISDIDMVEELPSKVDTPTLLHHNNNML
jgi:hypothetical protein